MSSIRDVNWETQITITSRQVRSLSLLAGFVADIKERLGDQAPTATREVNWESIESFFHEIKRLDAANKQAIKDVLEVIHSVNKGLDNSTPQDSS